MTDRELAGLKAIELWESGAFDADMILMVLGKRMGMSSSAELVHWLSSQGKIRGSKSKEKSMKTGMKLPRYGFQVCIALPNYLKCLKAVWVYSARDLFFSGSGKMDT